MGDTDFFVNYDIFVSGEHSLVERRENRVKTLDHAKSDKMKAVLELISDVHILVAQQRSPNFVRIARQTKYQPVIVSATDIQTVLSRLLAEFNSLSALAARRLQGEYPEAIPELGIRAINLE
jgi:hypothetical protein